MSEHISTIVLYKDKVGKYLNISHRYAQLLVRQSVKLNTLILNKEGDKYTYLSKKHENIAARLNYIKESYEILDQMLNMLAESG